MAYCIVKECNEFLDNNCENIAEHKTEIIGDKLIVCAYNVSNNKHSELKICLNLINSLFCDIEVKNQKKKIITSYIISKTLFIFYNIKNKSNNKENILCVISGELDYNNNIISNTLKNQMYFNIYHSAKQDELCKHLSIKLNLMKIKYDIYSSKFILLFKSDNKILVATLDYLMSIHSVATNIKFLKNHNYEFICIQGNPINIYVIEKNKYKIIYYDEHKHIKKVILCFCL